MMRVRLGGGRQRLGNAGGVISAQLAVNATILRGAEAGAVPLCFLFKRARYSCRN